MGLLLGWYRGWAASLLECELRVGSRGRLCCRDCEQTRAGIALADGAGGRGCGWIVAGADADVLAASDWRPAAGIGTGAGADCAATGALRAAGEGLPPIAVVLDALHADTDSAAGGQSLDWAARKQGLGLSLQPWRQDVHQLDRYDAGSGRNVIAGVRCQDPVAFGDVLVELGLPAAAGAVAVAAAVAAAAAARAVPAYAP